MRRSRRRRPRGRRRGRIGWAVGAAVALVLALVLAALAVAWQADANRTYDEARSGFASAAERVRVGAGRTRRRRRRAAGGPGDRGHDRRHRHRRRGGSHDTGGLRGRGGGEPCRGDRGRRGTRGAGARCAERTDADADADGADARPFWPWELAESEDELSARRSRGARHRGEPARTAGTVRHRGGGGGCRDAGALRLHASRGRATPGGEPLGAQHRPWWRSGRRRMRSPAART